MKKLLEQIHNYNPYQNFNYSLYKEDIGGWHGNHRIFLDLLDNIRPSMILEIGTWKGQSAINMAKIAKGLSLDTSIICVDTWIGSLEFIGANSKSDSSRDSYTKFGYPQIYYQFLANVLYSKVEDSIIPFPQTASIACRWLEQQDIAFDLVYIDGSNEYRDIICDIESAWPLLKKGGVIFGDDYNHLFFTDIKKAVDNFYYNNQKNHFETYDNDLFWLIKKDQ